MEWNWKRMFFCPRNVCASIFIQIRVKWIGPVDKQMDNQNSRRPKCLRQRKPNAMTWISFVSSFISKCKERKTRKERKQRGMELWWKCKCFHTLIETLNYLKMIHFHWSWIVRCWHSRLSKPNHRVWNLLSFTLKTWLILWPNVTANVV